MFYNVDFTGMIGNNISPIIMVIKNLNLCLND